MKLCLFSLIVLYAGCFLSFYYTVSCLPTDVPNNVLKPSELAPPPTETDKSKCEKKKHYQHKEGYTLTIYHCGGKEKICKGPLDTYYYELMYKDVLLHTLCSELQSKSEALEFSCKSSDQHLFNIILNGKCSTVQYTTTQTSKIATDYEIGGCNDKLSKREIVNCKKSAGMWCLWGSWLCVLDPFSGPSIWEEKR